MTKRTLRPRGPRGGGTHGSIYSGAWWIRESVFVPKIRLTIVARASLEELLIDYKDFMRLRGIKEWGPEHPYAQRLSELIRQGNTYDVFRRGVEHSDPNICANVIAGLIKTTTYLLDRQIRRLEMDFLRDGGLRERMSRARLAFRNSAAVNRPRPHRTLGPA